jgi:hypothetical protein
MQLKLIVPGRKETGSSQLGQRGACQRIALIGLCVLGGLCGCASGPGQQAAPAPKPGLLAFLEAPHVTREEVYARLGAPHATFEHEHVIAYRIAQNGRGYSIMAQDKDKKENWEGVSDDLVLAFDDEGILHQYSLVAIKAASDKK